MNYVQGSTKLPIQGKVNIRWEPFIFVNCVHFVDLRRKWLELCCLKCTALALLYNRFRINSFFCICVNVLKKWIYGYVIYTNRFLAVMGEKQRTRRVLLKNYINNSEAKKNKREKSWILGVLGDER